MTLNQSSYQHEQNVWSNQSYNQSSHWSYELWNNCGYLAFIVIQNESVNKLQVYNVIIDDADDVNNVNEIYYYNSLSNMYKSVTKCSCCHFHFNLYNKLVEHIQREEHKA